MASYSSYPKYLPPPEIAVKVFNAFQESEKSIEDLTQNDNAQSDNVLNAISKSLLDLGFEVELDKRHVNKIHRPVFFGQNGKVLHQYQIDAFHPIYKTGLEVEAGRAVMGNAIYRDLIIGLMLYDLSHLIIAVKKEYHFKSGVSKDYEKACDLADALFSTNRLIMPYSLTIIGY